MRALAHPSRLSRALTFRDLLVYGLLFIGPLAPVGVFGVLDARTNGAVALVYLLATIAMAFTAWSYAEMSRVVPHAGSVFAYATEGLGAAPGFLAGWMAMLDYLLIPSVAYLFSGIALHALVPAVPAWVFTVLAFLVTTALNVMGVRLAARVGTAVLLAEIAVLFVFLVFGALALGENGPARPWTSPFIGLGPMRPDVIVGAVSVAVLSYLGFDAIAGFAEENAGDPRDVGRAIIFCLGAAGLAFVAQTWMAATLARVDPSELAARPERQGTAFYDVTRAAIAPWLGRLLAITKAIGPAFAAMTGQAAAARLLFGMARDGRLPRVLAAVDARHGVPRRALGTAAVLTLAVSVVAARRANGLDLLVSIVDVGALAAFTLLHGSVVGYFVLARRQRARPAHLIAPLLGGLVTLWVIVEASPLAQAIGGGWAVAGVGVYLAQRGAEGRGRELPRS
jgi:amino acid transporter